MRPSDPPESLDPLPPLQPDSPPLPSPSRARFPYHQTVAGVTAIGTLLAGVAAVVALWPRSEATLATDVPTPPPETVSPPPVVTSFESLSEMLADISTTELPAGESDYATYDLISTASSHLSVPTAWQDRSNATWIAADGEPLGQLAGASANIDDLYDRLDVPGIVLATSALHLDPHDVIEGKAPDREALCEGGRANRFVGEGYSGEFRIWTRCGAPGSERSVTLDFVVQDTRFRTTILIFARLTDSRDMAALRNAVLSLETVAPQPGNEMHPALPPDHPAEGDPAPLNDVPLWNPPGLPSIPTAPG